MNTKWEFTFYKVILLYCAGILLGGAISLLVTRNIPVLGGVLQIVAMIFATVSLLISCRKK
jgi:hypothetical protein